MTLAIHNLRFGNSEKKVLLMKKVNKEKNKKIDKNISFNHSYENKSRIVKYTWSFDQKADKDFKKKLDKPTQNRIINWLDSHIDGIGNPRLLGKALKGELNNLWRYRVGKYRLIADIKDDIAKISILKIRKRNDIYKRK